MKDRLCKGMYSGRITNGVMLKKQRKDMFGRDSACGTVIELREMACTVQINYKIRKKVEKRMVK